MSNAAIAAIEKAFVDFLRSLFPFRSVADLREAWQQSGLRIPSFTLPQLQQQASVARERITSVILDEATERTPGLDAKQYIRRFLEELSNPRNSVEMFLPVLYSAFAGVPAYTTGTLYTGNNLHHNYRRDDLEWRRIEGITTTHLSHAETSDSLRQMVLDNREKKLEDVLTPIEYLEELCRYKLKLIPQYTYDIELFTDNIRLRLVEALHYLQSSLLPSLRFFASLHCAQLALFQNPIKTTGSGQYEPEKRTQTHLIMHPQRSYQDMLNEVASQLTSLPTFTARVKISTDTGRTEHAIKTLDPKQERDKPLFGQALQERIATIKERNHQNGYTSERSEVEEEIIQRQEQYISPPDEPTFRHPPRQA